MDFDFNNVNWIIVAPIIVAAIILVVFVIKRNNKDRKDLETFLNNDYNKEEKENDLNDQ